MEGNLFSFIDQKTFSILSSRHQDVYLRALLLLRAKVENTGSLSKKSFRAHIANEMQNIMNDENFAEEDEGFDDFDFQKAGDNALRIISRLSKCGWIYIQYDEEEFEEKIILREHARIILDAFDRIMDPDKNNHKGTNFQIYAQLQTANDKKRRTMYYALKQVTSIAEDYRDWLLSKSVNIKGEYLRRLLNQEMSAKEIAEEYLNNYTEQISKAILEPLKTYDDPKLYWSDIKDLLYDWEFSRFNEVLQQGIEANPDKNKDSIELEIRGFFRRLSDAYSDVPSIIESITKDDADYSMKAISKMKYIGTADSSLKGILIKAMNDSKEGNAIGLKMKDVIRLYSDMPLSVSSTLRIPLQRVTKRELEERPLTTFTPTKKDIDEIIKRLKSEHISQSEINAFVDKQLAGCKELSNANFSIITNRDYLLLLLSQAKAESRCSNYSIDFSPYLKNGNIVKVGEHLIPELIYKRKKNG